MAIGISIVFIAIGAVLIWAVNADVAGVSLDAIGLILLIVGGIGVLLSLVFWSSWGRPGRERREREIIVDR